MVKNNRYASPGALHLRPTRGTQTRINKLIRLSQAVSWVGMYPPEDAEVIKYEFDTHKARFETFLAQLERRAGQV